MNNDQLHNLLQRERSLSSDLTLVRKELAALLGDKREAEFECDGRTVNIRLTKTRIEVEDPQFGSYKFIREDIPLARFARTITDLSKAGKLSKGGGRPRKYKTDAEAKAARRESNRKWLRGKEKNEQK